MAFGRKVQFLKYKSLKNNDISTCNVVICKNNDLSVCCLDQLQQYLLTDNEIDNYITQYNNNVELFNNLMLNINNIKKYISDNNIVIQNEYSKYNIKQIYENLNYSNDIITNILENQFNKLNEIFTNINIEYNTYALYADENNLSELLLSTTLSTISDNNQLLLNNKIAMLNNLSNFSDETIVLKKYLSNITNEISSVYNNILQYDDNIINLQQQYINVLFPNLSNVQIENEISDLLITCTFEHTLALSDNTQTYTSADILNTVLTNQLDNIENYTSNYCLYYLTTVIDDLQNDKKVFITYDNDDNEDSSIIKQITFLLEDSLSQNANGNDTDNEEPENYNINLSSYFIIKPKILIKNLIF